MASSANTVQIILVSAWLILCGVESCDGQYHPGSYGPGLPPVGGVPNYHYPTSGLYGTNYQRPPYSQSYGYGYSNSHLRANDNSAEVLDNAQKAAMAPMNNVMSSLPIRADLVPLLPFSLPAVFQASQGRDASSTSNDSQSSKQCPNGKCPPETKTQAEATPGKTDSPTQQEPQVDRQLPTSSCACPCSYYSWLYGGYPFYDFSHASYPKDSTYTYAYPYAYSPDKSSRSARTFWLPWAQPSPPTVQNPYGRPGGNNYANSYYYPRRY